MRKKKRYLNQIIERLARGALKFRNPQVVQYWYNLGYPKSSFGFSGLFGEPYKKCKDTH